MTRGQKKKQQKVSSPLIDYQVSLELQGGGIKGLAGPLYTSRYSPIEHSGCVAVVERATGQMVSSSSTVNFDDASSRQKLCVSEVVQSCSAERKLAHTAHPTHRVQLSIYLLLLIAQFPSERAASLIHRVFFSSSILLFLRLEDLFFFRVEEFQTKTKKKDFFFFFCVRASF